ncbi:MAG: ATP-binding cassette domain-containing protein [Cyclobacteriaceae bacterium]|nr:ATP-binding cassette domain-containing protein [Cyclobacteriaceae bacterium HetDA_MAG_MS6]
MSEEILRAIIQLLAIVAKEDDVTLDEKASIENFLLESLTKEDTKKYLTLFEEWASTSTEDPELELKRINSICAQINANQTSQQKIVVILNLLELIAADGQISQRESELVYHMSEQLHVPKKLTDLIKAFVIFQERNKIASSNILIIDDGSFDLPDRCKRISLNDMNGFVFILRVPELEVYFAKYVGEDDVLINGTPMRTNRIYVFSLGSVIKVHSNDPVFHSDVISKFRQESDTAPISFVGRDITYKFKNGKIGLRNVNIAEEGGKLIALMGASGAGKSTLLNVLNGNETPAEGSVRVNGVDIHVNKKLIEGVIGYIPQDDLLVEELTVYENLFFAAKLCFKDKADKDLEALCNQTLEALGLYEIKNLRVGSSLEKSISGGQRKRLNIGLELLREPSVLFVDEPTSGLSSRDSENIMDLLKELSLKGKMIFVVIHQPSEDIFKMFDKLILLDVGGYQIYYGNPIESISYFKEIVHMVDRRRNANPEQVFNIIEAKVVNEFGNFTKKRKTSPYQWFQEFRKRIQTPKVEEVTDVPKKTLNIPGRVRQFFIFATRDLKSKLANKQYLIVNTLEAPLLAIILALIIKYIPEDSEVYFLKDNLNLPTYLFMSVIVALFMGLTVSAEEIIKDRKLLKREAFLNLSRFSYLASKVGILFSISALQTFTFVVIGNFILEIQGMTTSFWVTLFSVSCFANALGLNISSAFKSAITVYILIPLLIIPQLILSGIVVNFDKLNPAISDKERVPVIGEIMASRWAYEAMAVAQFKDNAYEALFYPSNKIMAQSEFKTIYFIPKLESDLEYIHHHIDGVTEEEHHQIDYRLTTIRNEIEKELSKIGRENFQHIDDLSRGKFTDETFEESMAFLKKLKAYYNLKFKKEDAKKRALIKNMTEAPNGSKSFKDFRYAHENDAISLLVKNTSTEHRILENNNTLIQKLYPIYMDPEFPTHSLDFRTQFYLPTKHFLGTRIDTLVFNNLIIWTMTVFLLIALYFRWLKKVISGFPRR